MSKMTLDTLKTFIASYVAEAKQAGAYAGTVDEYTKMIEKIGKQITIDGVFQDKLAGLFEGEDLPYGKTIEEYFMDIPSPVDFEDGVSEEDTWKTYRPTFEEACYSYTLGRRKIPLVDAYDTIEAVCNDGTALSELASDKFKKFQDAYTNVVYSQKEQLLGNVYAKVNALTDETIKGKMMESLAKPTDTETGEAFILRIKECVEDASDRNESNCLSGSLIGVAPSLVLIVNKKVLPNLDVNTLAGAFHEDKLALGVEVRTVDSFGTVADTANVYAMLVDPRGIKIHNSYNAIRSDSNANKDAVRYIRHYENTGFISKYTYAHIFKTA